ncbi:SDR family oxidoreductase [Francisella adeliensis]|uniref:Oxidoreductase n=1 Tax=Francisella adeliensis TaxID=2007306 RepID=A0A2Z4XY60_9GAMM|nr:SDR family oxidoreductase [Francisella adeliensis]AXA33837.1 oxidoreductase [Francisella adeliensis]MBK2085738.1 SDR family oxidoreductase [Francisella adeliensis]MBK2097616.1 SDR family oxidoreductase [Francisella adeliensis]QIW12074.1 SDR family oxidoreductase [Francisella adeliensis]QIW13948.1 SDR family oxidoreductase [Francisella adeliensis]
MSKSLVVITGASSGIGAAIAKRFSEAGHSLLLIGRRVEKMQELNLPNTMIRKVDVTDIQALKNAIKDAEAEYGAVELLVNNAGLMLLGQIDNQDPIEWQKMYDVNVLALLNGMQAVLGDMRARKSGTIINISSIAGKKSFPNHAAYVGTKFAVSSMSENVREEVADDNVRIMTICPGAVETELLSHTTSDQIKSDYESWKESMGGVLVADDIARTASFMYSQPQNINIREVVIAATRQPA